MGGVDKHDRLVGQHAIPLISKRGYLRIFFHLSETDLVNAWILFRTTIQARGEWNQAAKRGYTLAWFKEIVILSLCGHHTSRKYQASHTGNHPTLPTQSWNWSLSIKCNRSKVSSQTLLQGKEDVSFAKLHNVLLVWHGNRYTAIRAVGNIYTKSYCSILQQVRFKQKENKVYPSILNRIQEYYQQRTSCLLFLW